MGASSGSPDGTCLVHRGIDELLIQQNTIPDGEITFPASAPDLYVSTRLAFIKGHPKKTNPIDPLDWLSKELN